MCYNVVTKEKHAAGAGQDAPTRAKLERMFIMFEIVNLEAIVKRTENLEGYDLLMFYNKKTHEIRPHSHRPGTPYIRGAYVFKNEVELMPTLTSLTAEEIEYRVEEAMNRHGYDRSEDFDYV